MTTVQLAIHDSEYAQSLRNLLLRDGTHRVLLVDKPDLKVHGVVVVESNSCEDLSALGALAAERFVVITRKGSDHLTKIWEAGVRHVVFEEDSPTTAQLAVIAAELRMPKIDDSSARQSGLLRSVRPDAEKRHRMPDCDFTVLGTPRRCSYCCSVQNPLRII